MFLSLELQTKFCYNFSVGGPQEFHVQILMHAIFDTIDVNDCYDHCVECDSNKQEKVYSNE